MAPQKTSHEFLGIVILSVSLICVACANYDNDKESGGLTIKLISRFSTSSPIYQANLTHLDFLRQLSHLYKQRRTWLSSTCRTTDSSDLNYLHPKMSVTLSNSMYAVKAFIGTPPRKYYLLFDTGSEFTWIQCEGCHPCFHIKDGNFTPGRSSTYKEIAYNDRHCITKLFWPGNKCGYKAEYTNHASSEGVVSIDNFMFDGSHGRLETVSNVLFGCGLKNDVSSFKNSDKYENVLGGILGMGGGSSSFISQLGTIANGRFSYCVQPLKPHERVETTLRFGTDAALNSTQSTVQITPLLKSKTHPGYFLHLMDISVNGNMLGLPPETFKIRQDAGGLLSDMGTTVTRLYKTPYERLKRELKLFFRAQNLTQITIKDCDLCYRLPNITVSWPSVTFHFKDANFHIIKEALFGFEGDAFCMMIACAGATDKHAEFGAFQQAGYRFMVDTKHEYMQFAREDCN